MPSRQGSPNKNKEFLNARLRDMYGQDFDVIMMMAENCVALHKIAQEHRPDINNPEGKITAGDEGLITATTSAKTAIEALDKLAQYCVPKLKAIEVTGDPDNPVEHNHTWEINIRG